MEGLFFFGYALSKDRNDINDINDRIGHNGKIVVRFNFTTKAQRNRESFIEGYPCAAVKGITNIKHKEKQR